ncbi:hypothetical protein RFI_39097 [Reticulomyxa filosa]|uniref:Uncharacterized protein n=1 Tax=Reticulomyxa filosa TaxID=46433 RepID=X6L8S2_RETFI|nr:hypothetical protein RFI_39097 [Reticulomyxa filosa]|eukprot:ETN98402.1 hypothetical protein RFI_39097 [Reticulomyxa filosa]
MVKRTTTTTAKSWQDDRQVIFNSWKMDDQICEWSNMQRVTRTTKFFLSCGSDLKLIKECVEYPTVPHEQTKFLFCRIVITNCCHRQRYIECIDTEAHHRWNVVRLVIEANGIDNGELTEGKDKKTTDKNKTKISLSKLDESEYNEINCELRFSHDCIRGVVRDATRSFTVRSGLRNDKTQTNNNPFTAFHDKHKQHNDSNAFGNLLELSLKTRSDIKTKTFPKKKKKKQRLNPPILIKKNKDKEHISQIGQKDGRTS